MKKRRGVGVEGELAYRLKKRSWSWKCESQWIQDLPPASGRQPFGIHLAHVAHTNQSDDEVLHPLGDGLRL